MRKAIIVSFLVSILLCGCWNKGPYDLKAVDDLSRSVKKVMGNDFDFHGLSTDENGKKYYSFEIKTITAETLGNIVEEFNKSLSDSDEKISLRIEATISAGAWGAVCYMQNYSEGDGGNELYDGMRYLRICDVTNTNDSYCDPELYSQIEGIRELHIAKVIQEKADEMEIDWYSYWPDLETIVIEEN